MSTFVSIGSSNQRQFLINHDENLKQYSKLLNKIATLLEQNNLIEGEELDYKKYLIKATEILKQDMAQKRYLNFEIKLSINDRSVSTNEDITSLLEQLEKIKDTKESNNISPIIIEELLKRINIGKDRNYKIYNPVDSKQLCKDLELVKEGSTFYISLNYRVNNINTITKTVSKLTDIKGILNVLSESIIDYEDKCGVIGNRCSSINEGLDVFLHLINNVFSNSGYKFSIQEIGNITMSNDIMIQKYKLVKHLNSSNQKHNGGNRKQISKKTKKTKKLIGK
jgi:hypothetical protein